MKVQKECGCAGRHSLCDTCVHARVIRGHSQNEEITLCKRLYEPIVIPFAVKECADYLQKLMFGTAKVKEFTWEIRISHSGVSEDFALATGEIKLGKNPEDA